MIISKSYTFEASHRLPYHDGKCRNLHGHSYKVRVYVKGPVQSSENNNPEAGMVLDFARLDEVMNPLLTVLDHYTLLWEGDPLRDRLESWASSDRAYVRAFPFMPTAESLATYIHIRVRTAWAQRGPRDLQVKVRVYETEKSYAETDFS